ncbi:MAG: tRNA (guanine-N(1)-)-methyltransferase [Firmicutes bacterium ADurb.Bin248]|nr:MAG: tRNA (guanine-N(1)-)-methyltransferase [Firmicutes bacterium ADurb.Bin248]HOF99983.1 tRNA (guanosine(37)-N1)-methyltransferase TrmD [Clostridia bacterium]
MRIDILSIFPGMFGGVLSSSMLGRAAEKGLLEFHLHDIRAYSDNKHRNTDDYPFGGGAGMVMMAQPVYSCIEVVDPGHEAYRVTLSPRGEVLTPKRAKELSEMPRLLLLCGHYEGIDERVSYAMDAEISIGDYVLTGGELPAMVLVDCVSRFVPGVLGSEDSAGDESFSDGLLEYPQYTRPASFRGMDVPEVLLNGNHALIARFRRDEALKLTYARRPELIEEIPLDKADKALLESLKNQANQGK